MRFCFLSSFLLITYLGYGQTIHHYAVPTKDDTLTIALTDAELVEAKKDRVLELRLLSKLKKKKTFQENIRSNLKLVANDTIFNANLVDYFDGYVIAFVSGPVRRVSRHLYTAMPLGFRRIRYDEIEWINTNGKRNPIPRLLLGTIAITLGTSLTTIALVEPKNRDTISPLWLPLALGTLYVGVKMYSEIVIRRFLMSKWRVEVK